MGLHWIPSLPAEGDAAGQLPGAEPVVVSQRHGIGFDLADPALERLLHELVVGRADLTISDHEAADVIITDRQSTDDLKPRHGRVLRLGAEHGRRNALDSVEPQMILAAASLMAAGYSLDRDAANSDDPSSVAAPRLSQRERQVAELLVDGASNKVIARSLDISVHTAKFHVTGILDKLGARNRADAVAILLRGGLIQS
ncbi:helix-turn-helix domain-containing protein [Devosia sp.]|uniref:helix-turn-helix transcriptional regulator n=1 Tax=Devosia sp. TaxID=1871048 RepID=UPI003A8FF858